MMVRPTPRPEWRRPAHAVRYLLERVFRRRTRSLSDEFGQPQVPEYGGRLAPAVEDTPKLIRSRIETLVTENAIDEGTLPVLGGTIASWVNQWSAQFEQQHLMNQRRLRHHANEVRAERDRITAELNLLRDAINEVNGYIAHLTR